MLNQTDEKWLRATHPGLAFADKVVHGDLRFSASYDRATNTFVLLGDPQAGILKGETLSGSFRVHIQERTDKSVSKPTNEVREQLPSTRRTRPINALPPFRVGEFTNRFFDESCLPSIYRAPNQSTLALLDCRAKRPQFLPTINKNLRLERSKHFSDPLQNARTPHYERAPL